MRESQHEEGNDRSSAIPPRWMLFGGLLCVHIFSRLEPGGYLFWNGIQTLSAAALFPGAIWTGWRSKGVATRFALVAFLVVVAMFQWGIPKLRNSWCGESIEATLSSADARAVSIKSDCGATTAESYRVVLIAGRGLFRRRSVVLESYLSPVPSIVSLDSHSLNVDLRFIPRDSMVNLEIPLADLNKTWQFYRGVPRKD